MIASPGVAGRRRAGRRWALAGSAALLVAVGISVPLLLLGGQARPDPDPGGLRMALLGGLLSALPTDAAVTATDVTRPQRSDCDGHHSWTNAHAGITFTSRQPRAALVAHTAAALRRGGWSVTERTVAGWPQAVGSHPLPQGTSANVLVQPYSTRRDGPVVGWQLLAVAQPAHPGISC